MTQLRIYIDGACRGNPGPASFGICIYDSNGDSILEFGEYIGPGTNSIAEHKALERALIEAHKFKVDELFIYTDSQLVARQFHGIYKVKHKPIQEILLKVHELEKGFKTVQVEHIPRSSQPGNKRADQLANIALNKAGF